MTTLLSSSIRMQARVVALPLLFTLSTLSALSGCKSAEEKLADSRTELRQLEDGLFSRYGGSAIASQVDQQARAAGQDAQQRTGDALAGMVGEVVGNAARAMDREMFSQDCRRVGRGESVPFLTDKGRLFFERPDTRDACVQIAKIADNVTRLERELGIPARVP